MERGAQRKTNHMSHNTLDTEAPFSSLHLFISNGFVSSKIYDKRDDRFDIVTFPFSDGDVPRRPSYGVYISQLIRFARVCSHVDDLNARNKCLTARLPKHIGIIRLERLFPSSIADTMNWFQNLMTD